MREPKPCSSCCRVSPSADVEPDPLRFADIYRTEPSRRRECLYFLAVGHYKLGNYPESKRYNGALPSCRACREQRARADPPDSRVPQDCCSRRSRTTSRRRASTSSSSRPSPRVRLRLAGLASRRSSHGDSPSAVAHSFLRSSRSHRGLCRDGHRRWRSRCSRHPLCGAHEQPRQAVEPFSQPLFARSTRSPRSHSTLPLVHLLVARICPLCNSISPFSRHGTETERR